MHKTEIQRPDSWMLSYGKSSQGTVKSSPTSCDLTLRHEELAVIKPYSGHLNSGKEDYLQIGYH